MYSNRTVNRPARLSESPEFSFLRATLAYYCATDDDFIRPFQSLHPLLSSLIYIIVRYFSFHSVPVYLPCRPLAALASFSDAQIIPAPRPAAPRSSISLPPTCIAYSSFLLRGTVQPLFPSFSLNKPKPVDFQSCESWTMAASVAGSYSINPFHF